MIWRTQLLRAIKKITRGKALVRMEEDPLLLEEGATEY
jgi:hypothetical protein